MSENHDKRKIWYYAVILFTSAFVVLLLTAYSQIKFNKNIDDYRNQLSSGEKERNKFKMDLNSALKENEKLTQKIDSMQKELDKAAEEKSQQQYISSQVKEQYDKTVSNYQVFIQAQQAFQSKDYITAANLLKSACDSSAFDGKTLESYKVLRDQAFKEAGKVYFNMGMSYYSNKQYAQATDNYLKSIEYGASGIYWDECYYYLAHSQYGLKNMEKAKGYANQLLLTYPETPYKKSILKLLRQIEK